MLTGGSPADYELCEVIAFDPVPELRRDALDALEKVQPKLYPLAVSCSRSISAYSRTLGLPATRPLVDRIGRTARGLRISSKAPTRKRSRIPRSDRPPWPW